MKEYNKLVRDEIAETIMSEGHSVTMKIISDDEMESALREKLREEVGEFIISDEIEELADVIEVVYSIALRRGVSADELDRIKDAKSDKKGGFERGVFLIETSEEQS